jgi:hypothetical protein
MLELNHKLLVIVDKYIARKIKESHGFLGVLTESFFNSTTDSLAKASEVKSFLKTNPSDIELINFICGDSWNHSTSLKNELLGHLVVSLLTSDESERVRVKLDNYVGNDPTVSEKSCIEVRSGLVKNEFTNRKPTGSDDLTKFSGLAKFSDLPRDCEEIELEATLTH